MNQTKRIPKVLIFAMLTLIFSAISAEVISREENFEFAQLPTLTTEGGNYVISFTTQAKCDVTVSIRDKNGYIIRHLASGVLGSNAPTPFVKDSLHQRLVWDKLDDQGNPAPADCKIIVSLGLNAEHEMDIGWKPVEGTYIMKDGAYFRTLFPPPAETPESLMTQIRGSNPVSGAPDPIHYATTIWGDRVPYGGWFSVFQVLDNFSIASQAMTLLAPFFNNKEPPRKAAPYLDTMVNFSRPHYHLAVCPRTEDLYVGGWMTPLFRINGVTGRLDTTWYQLDKVTEQDVGPDGLIYLVTGDMGWGRYLFRLDRNGHEVLFPDKSAVVKTSEITSSWYSNFPMALAPGNSRGITLTEAIPTGVTTQTDVNEDGFDVSITGRIAGIFDFGGRTLRIWESSGKLVNAMAAVNPARTLGHGLRMDRDNNIYLVEGGAVPSGQSMLDGITDVGTSYRVFGGHGSLIKYADNGSYPLDVGPGADPKYPGSLWVYGGMTDQAAGDCSCNHSRHDMDGWARSWIPARQLESIVVIDANGNRIARLGRYGNVDDVGLRFAWVRGIAVSDKAFYANDAGNHRILKAKLYYENEAVVSLDGTVQLSPGEVSVSIQDIVTHAPITTPATLSLLRSGVVVDTVSSRTGILKVSSDSGSSYTVNISAAGYLPATVNNVVIKGGKTTAVVVPCTRQALVGIDIQPDTLNILANSQAQPCLYGLYADGTPLLLDSTVVPVWTSRSPNIFSVGNSGLVLSHAQTGSCFIVAGVTSLGLSDSCFAKTITIDLRNPSFETPASASDWIFAPICGNDCGSSIQANGGPYKQADAPDGTHVAALQSRGSFSQQVTFEAGAYKVQFMAAIRTNWDGNLQHQTIKVYIDSMEIGSFNPNTAGFTEYITSSFTVTAGIHTLKFTGTSVGDNTAFVDAVGFASGTTTDKEQTVILPENLSFASSPNPFNPVVNIAVSGWRSGTELKILDISGKVAADLTTALNSGSRGSGSRQVAWNASGHASGVYIFMLRYGKIELKRKAILIR